MTPLAQAIIHTVVFLTLIVAYVVSHDQNLLAAALGYGGAAGASVTAQATKKP